MRKIIKIFLGLLIDCAFLCCLSILVRLFLKATLGCSISIAYLTVEIAVGIFYLTFMLFNRWMTPCIKLIMGQKKVQIPAKKIFLASFLDWFLIFSCTLVINFVLRQFVFLDTIVLFTIIAFLYYVVFYLTLKQTLGYYFCGIELTSKSANTRWSTTIIKQEFFKYGLGAWFPLGLLAVFHVKITWEHILLLLFLHVFVFFLYYAGKGESWWNTIGKTQTQQKSSPLKFKYFIRLGYLGFIALTFIVLLLHNNIGNPSSDKFLGFNIPFKRIEYPNNRSVKPYTAFLREQAQNPKEYLLSLFDKYDIVVLCEHLHTEDTQWDFIYDVVSDTQFVKKVGHIFTEYGCTYEQSKVDSFMQTSFSDSISLAKATATLMNYHSGNFYFFMQKLHTFNQTLPDSFRIQEHFTDVSGWNYLRSAYYDTMLNEQNTIKYERDSLMAQVVIDWHEQTGGKCLVVTNYRHAFAVKNNASSKNYDNEAQYIYDRFPEKTANVLMHGHRFNNIFLSPVQHGKWDRAMKENGNTPVGFDFDGSPFGNDKFDMFPTRKYFYLCHYQDVFNGYVFYKPENKLTHSEPPYRKYAAEKEYEWAMQNNLIDTVQGKMLVNSYQNIGGKINNTDFLILHLNLYHFVDLLIWGLWAVIVFLITVVSSLRLIVKRR